MPVSSKRKGRKASDVSSASNAVHNSSDDCFRHNDELIGLLQLGGMLNHNYHTHCDVAARG